MTRTLRRASTDKYTEDLEVSGQRTRQGLGFSAGTTC